MSESLESVNVAATRQKAGRFLKASADGGFVPGGGGGGVKAPLATASASVILAFGILSKLSLSHDCPARGDKSL
jgi:hypothetical protein